MKKTVRVTIETEIEVDINDDDLTAEAVKEFQDGMFYIDGPDDLFKYAGTQFAQFGAIRIEGLGEVKFAENTFDSTAEIVG